MWKTVVWFARHPVTQKVLVAVAMVLLSELQKAPRRTQR